MIEDGKIILVSILAEKSSVPFLELVQVSDGRLQLPLPVQRPKEIDSITGSPLLEFVN